MLLKILFLYPQTNEGVDFRLFVRIDVFMFAKFSNKLWRGIDEILNVSYKDMKFLDLSDLFKFVLFIYLFKIRGYIYIIFF